MKFKPLGKGMEGDVLVEPFEVEDGLTIGKVINHISLLVNQGFSFESARINSSSDKDNWKAFSGSETYSEYETFMNMLQSETLINEEGLIVSFSGEIDKANKRIAYFMDENWVIIHTPISDRDG